MAGEERSIAPAAPQRMRRGLVQTPVGAIEYLELGAGPPVLALHPTPGSCLWYADVAPLLADERRVIAMTTMGYGRSDRPDPPYATVREYAEAAIAFLDGLGVERTSVIGSHTGSLLAVEIAAGWPQRVDRLVLGEPFNWNTPARREALTRQHTYVAPTPDGSHLLELWRRQGPDRPGVDLQEFAGRFADFLVVNAPEPTYGPLGWEGAGPYVITRYELWERAALVEAPTLVIHGTESDLARSQPRFLETIPRSRGIRLPSEGRFSPRQAPKLWAREVTAFLREPGV
ncbi:MAG: alpha/beta hydrolase [Chloroflexi bacterium]|nr:alpha/beta hydrolase [Chloroflexota bacterium]